jgi:hypothetical protein
VPSPSAMQWETIGVAVMAVLSVARILLGLIHWLLAAGDEGWQTLDLALGVGAALRRAGLRGLWRLGLRKCLRVARNIGLRLARTVRRFAHGTHRGLPVFITLIKAFVAPPLHVVLGTGEVGIVLPILVLRRRDHAVIVLGVLIIIFSGNRITGRLRIARKLNVFFCDMRRITANFHIRPVRLIYARHWIVTLAMVISPAHPLVLTVSHDLPAANPFGLAASCTPPCLAKSPMLSRASNAAASATSPLKQEIKARPFSPLFQLPYREAATPDRRITRRCPPLPHAHARLAREPAQNR